MAKANFDIVIFNEQIGGKEGSFKAPFYQFVGDQTTQKNFNIPGVPTGHGYIILQVYDVQNKGEKTYLERTLLEPGRTNGRMSRTSSRKESSPKETTSSKSRGQVPMTIL
jgi:hypothetical protein